MAEQEGKDRLALTGARIYTESGCREQAAIELAGERIADITPKPKSGYPTLKLPETWHIVPGFIDSHLHGAVGVDVMDASGEALDTLCRYLPAEGSTSFLATTMTANPARIRDALTSVGEFRSAIGQAEILGVHLEGPFLAPAKAGAQGADWMIAPDVALYHEWQKLAHGKIKVVTLAPETSGAMQFIAHLTDAGVQASIGHTNCALPDAREAIAGGCRRATHLFNAMSGLHHRNPGAACAVLLADRVTAEIIPDGVHVSPAMLRLAYRIKTPARLMAVTDSMRAKGLGDGIYDLGGAAVHVKGNEARRDSGALAGSVLRMDQGFRNILRMFDCSLGEGIEMASTNPAANLGVIKRKGSLAPGKDADLVVLDEKLTVRISMCRGRIAFNSSRKTTQDAF